MIGRTLSHFRVTGKLGAGGMGEVYRALDTRLKRDVAIKVLPAALAHDPDRLARMEREARSLAALTHPNIAAIHGLEEAEGTRFLVLELVNGETLAERLGRGPLPVRDALQVSRQIALGLEAAHQRGVIHRDLKPENIKITEAGDVKILDFGLARITRTTSEVEDASQETTLSAPTTEGTILGTPAYMSPEQARGQKVDQRTDIWAFGCILFELLTGRKTFRRTSTPDTIAAILTREPEWERLPRGLPPRITYLLHRCLNKDQKDRLRDAADARIEIDDALAGRVTDAPDQPSPSRRWRSLLAVSTFAALAIGAASSWLILSHRPGPQSPSWVGDLLVGGTTVTWGPRISPDGQTLAFVSLVEERLQVGVMKPGTGFWKMLTKDRSQGISTQVSWSHDGSRIYFDRGYAIYSISALGGEERLVLDHAWIPEALPDGSLLVTRNEPDGTRRLYRFWPEDGRLMAMGPKLQPILPLREPVRAFHDGKEAVFLGIPADAPPDTTVPSLYILDLDSGKAHLLRTGFDGRFTQSFSIPLGVSADGQSIVTAVPAGDLYQVVAIDRAGGAPKVLVSLMRQPRFLDIGPDGSLYIDQSERPFEILRFTPAGGVPSRIARSIGTSIERSAVLGLPDGRVLFTSTIGARTQCFVSGVGEEPTPFVETSEDAAGPAALVGNSQVALFMGRAADPTLILATLDGRIQHRFPEVKGGRVTGMAASPDGKTLYLAESGSVWAIGLAGGDRRKICRGDSIAVDPKDGDLLVYARESDGVHLARVSPSVGASTEIPVSGQYRISPWDLPMAGSVDPAGRVLVIFTTKNSWFDRAGLIDSTTGSITPVDVDFDGDIGHATWEPDGSIVAAGVGVTGAIWRLRPTSPIQ
ncbi:MAG TPA: protein kinase [Candidatus Polarisedimenticolia bacterium]|nr:protein kinase [Candidatus Polarisedimenticolia bacterium]